MITHFKLPSNFVGFDTFFHGLNNFTRDTVSSFPHYNVKKMDEENYKIELALAGYDKDSINIELEDGSLKIEGTSIEEMDEETHYYHRGIANRSFSKSFKISDDIQIKNAEYENGILTISLIKIVPESKKPIKIDIQDKKGK